jgi:hypothetical protein
MLTIHHYDALSAAQRNQKGKNISPQRHEGEKRVSGALRAPIFNLNFVLFVLLYLKICAAYANDLETESTRTRICLSLRKGKNSYKAIFTPRLRTLRPSRLCGRYSDSFGCGFAALGSSR